MTMMKTQQIFAAILVAFLGLSVIISTVEACVCEARHSQQHYCKSDYVIVARIVSRRMVQRGRSMYKIEIRKTYKMSETANELLKHGRIFSSDSDSMCGIDLRLGELYLIAASGVNVGICNFIQPYSQLTIVEKRGFAGGYKKGCECNIDTCYNPEECSRTIGGCTWFGPWMDSCESNYGVCVPSRGFRDANGRPTKCHWRRNTSYTQCLHDP